jgi:hypothetical protein
MAADFSSASSGMSCTWQATHAMTSIASNTTRSGTVVVVVVEGRHGCHL